MTPSAGLIQAGVLYDGANVCFSTPHHLMMKLATEHAVSMAASHHQSHNGFDQRYALMQKEITDCISFAEICAESWSWQADDSMEDLGKEMFKCWEQSEGHWKIASVKHKYFGCDMKRGSNNIWYACIIVGD
jgi:hypothetical protein